jgi:hypothetical protein
MVILRVKYEHLYYFSDIKWNSDGNFCIVIAECETYHRRDLDRSINCKETLLLHSAVQVNKFLSKVIVYDGEYAYYFCTAKWHKLYNRDYFCITLCTDQISWKYNGIGHKKSNETMLFHSAVQVWRQVYAVSG